MLEKITNILVSKKNEFQKLCIINGIKLDYKRNKSELYLLKCIFYNREYSDYFPFYKKATVIDIGAHYGYFSIFASKNLDKSSKIISIEPSKNNFQQLNSNVENCKLTNVNCFNIAIGAKKKLGKLYKSKSVNHSIFKDYSLLKNNLEYEDVKINTLENIIIENKLDKIDFLKMDCEGAEYSILENTPKKIFDKIQTISLEFHDLKDKNYTAQRIVDILIENDFKIVKYQYSKTSMNLNYGKIIGTKIFNGLK